MGKSRLKSKTTKKWARVHSQTMASTILAKGLVCLCFSCDHASGQYVLSLCNPSTIVLFYKQQRNEVLNKK